MRKHGAVVRHFAKSIGIIILIALALEVFLFNINFFTSAGYNTINLDDKLQLASDTDPDTGNTYYEVTEVNHTIEFSNLNAEVHNIQLDFDDGQAAQELTLKINFTDEAHKTFFDDTEYTEGVPEVNVSTSCTQSEYINLNTSGYVDVLRIDITGEDISYPIRLNDVKINAHHPFDFNMPRFLVTTGILLLIFAFRPKSRLYQISIVGNPRKSKAVIIATVVLEVYLISAFLFMGTNLVGIATSSYNSGSWDGTSIVNTYAAGGDNAQQYAELAESLAQGKAYLEEEPPQWLQDMDDPYDKGARDELQKQTGEPYLFDVAYYEGHYYVYFGVVPVLIFYLPFYLLTGASFPTALGVLFAAIAFILGCSALLDRFARYHFRKVSLGLYLLLQIPLVFACGILYLLKFPTFYSLPIMCGLAFSVWGLYFWMRGRMAEKPQWNYLFGSLYMALVVGCRPQLVVLSFLAFPLFWRSFITKRHLFTPEGRKEFICLIAPYFVVAAALMGYNYARFGSFTDFGANYNLTVNDMTKRGWNIGRLAPAFFSYFLQPPTVTGFFPFIQPATFETTYMGQTIKEVTFGGIFACLPILWVLPFAHRILRLRIRQRSTKTIMGVIVVLIATGILVALLDAEMAGILQRYYADFSFMFLAAAVLLIFIVNENLEEGSTSKEILTKVLLTLVTLTVIYSALICFIPETGWWSDAYPWAYQNIVESVQFWT